MNASKHSMVVDNFSWIGVAWERYNEVLNEHWKSLTFCLFNTTTTRWWLEWAEGAPRVKWIWSETLCAIASIECAPCPLDGKEIVKSSEGGHLLVRRIHWMAERLELLPSSWMEGMIVEPNRGTSNKWLTCCFCWCKAQNTASVIYVEEVNF